MSFLDCAALGDHVAQDCLFRKGGFPSMAVINLDHTITNWEDATQWQTNIDSGKVKIANRVKVSVPNPTPVKNDSPIGTGPQQITDGFDWKLEGTDANRNAFNDDFYKSLNLKSVYIVLWNQDESEIIVIDEPARFTASPTFPASNRERQQYALEAEWSSRPNWFPTTFAEPAGIFEE